MSKPILAYWKIRGLGETLRMILRYGEVDFEDFMYEAGDPPDYSRECWFREKYNLGLEFPNLPYFIDGDFKLTETTAILEYICAKYLPSLMGESVEARATAKMLLTIVKDIKKALVFTCYDPNYTNLIAAVIAQVSSNLERLSHRLTNGSFLMGDAPIHADFLLFETIEMLDAISPGKSKEISPHFDTFRERFLTLNNMREFVSRERLIWNNKNAQFF